MVKSGPFLVRWEEKVLKFKAMLMLGFRAHMTMSNEGGTKRSKNKFPKEREGEKNKVKRSNYWYFN
jgi:hypothetical protein